MPEGFKPVLRREMEVYAGFMEYTDHHVGRLVDSLNSLGIADDTLIYYIAGDNGASAEGSLNGCYNEMSYFNGLQLSRRLNTSPPGSTSSVGPSYNHYAVGWAHAMNTPYQWTKQVASHWGGTRNGTVIHWPKGIKGKGEIRSQFGHVIDVAPTILEAAGIPEPLSVNGITQSPIEGVSMLYTFNDAKAAERHQTQSFEMFGNRGVYHQGWTAVTGTRIPGRRKNPRRSMTMSGSSTTPPRTGASRRTSPRRCRTSSASCSGSGSSKRPATTCYLSTIGCSRESIPISPAGQG